MRFGALLLACMVVRDDASRAVDCFAWMSERIGMRFGK